MDRNIRGIILLPAVTVATREGGGDRNAFAVGFVVTSKPSPPARVAWIETPMQKLQIQKYPVATREGGVDRNTNANTVSVAAGQSPPARVAWIETR